MQNCISVIQGTFYVPHMISALLFGLAFYWTLKNLYAKNYDWFFCTIFSAILTSFTIWAFLRVDAMWWLAPIIVFLIRLIKETEIYKKSKRRTFNYMNIVSDFVGISTVTVCYILTFRI